MLSPLETLFPAFGHPSLIGGGDGGERFQVKHGLDLPILPPPPPALARPP